MGDTIDGESEGNSYLDLSIHSVRFDKPPQPAENSPAEAQPTTETAETTLGEGGQADEAPAPAALLAPAAEQVII